MSQPPRVHARAQVGRSERLIVRYRSGDLSAFGELHGLHAAGVRAYLRTVLRDDDAVQDVAQQIFLKVFQALPTLEVERVPFRPWLYVIARTTAIDYVRKHRRTETVDPDELDQRRESAPGDAFEGLAWGSSGRIHELIDDLPLPQKQVLVLLYRCALPVADVAAVLGRTRESVRQLRHRALATLHKGLEAVDRPARNVS